MFSIIWFLQQCPYLIRWYVPALPHLDIMIPIYVQHKAGHNSGNILIALFTFEWTYPFCYKVPNDRAALRINLYCGSLPLLFPMSYIGGLSFPMLLHTVTDKEKTIYPVTMSLWTVFVSFILEHCECITVDAHLTSALMYVLCNCVIKPRTCAFRAYEMLKVDDLPFILICDYFIYRRIIISPKSYVYYFAYRMYIFMRLRLKEYDSILCFVVNDLSLFMYLQAHIPAESSDGPATPTADISYVMCFERSLSRFCGIIPTTDLVCAYIYTGYILELNQYLQRDCHIYYMYMFILIGSCSSWINLTYKCNELCVMIYVFDEITIYPIMHTYLILLRWRNSTDNPNELFMPIYVKYYSPIYMTIYASSLLMSLQARRWGTMDDDPRASCGRPNTIFEVDCCVCATATRRVSYSSCSCLVAPHSGVVTECDAYTHPVRVSMYIYYQISYTLLYMLCFMYDTYVFSIIINYIRCITYLRNQLRCSTRDIYFILSDTLYLRCKLQMSNVQSLYITLHIFDILSVEKFWAYRVFSTICHLIEYLYTRLPIKYRILVTNMYIVLVTLINYSYSLLTMNSYDADSLCSIYSRAHEYTNLRHSSTLADIPRARRSLETDTPQLRCSNGISSRSIEDRTTIYHRDNAYKVLSTRTLVFSCIMLGSGERRRHGEQHIAYQYEILNQVDTVYDLVVHSRDCNVLHVAVPGHHVSVFSTKIGRAGRCTFELYEFYIYLSWASYE